MDQETWHKSDPGMYYLGQALNVVMMQVAAASQRKDLAQMKELMTSCMHYFEASGTQVRAAAERYYNAISYAEAACARAVAAAAALEDLLRAQERERN